MSTSLQKTEDIDAAAWAIDKALKLLWEKHSGLRGMCLAAETAHEKLELNKHALRMSMFITMENHPNAKELTSTSHLEMVTLQLDIANRVLTHPALAKTA
jgi:hypothetical protein